MGFNGMSFGEKEIKPVLLSIRKAFYTIDKNAVGNFCMNASDIHCHFTIDKCPNVVVTREIKHHSRCFGK